MEYHGTLYHVEPLVCLVTRTINLGLTKVSIERVISVLGSQPERVVLRMELSLLS